MTTSARIAAAVLTTAGACLAAAGEPPAAPAAAVAVPAGHEARVQLKATGVQIYKCAPLATAAGGFDWTFVAPEATLFGQDGAVAGRHYAGPTWEAGDGSKVVGKLVAKAPAPDSASIPWLLLGATVVQAGGTFDGVTYVQRLNTRGGVAPATGCSGANAGAEARVPYSADYQFYTARK